MKNGIVVLGLMLVAGASSAAGLSCEDLKTRIEKKVESKGVKAYTLTVVSKDTPSKNRVVGACDKGSMKILYERAKSKESTDKAS